MPVCPCAATAVALRERELDGLLAAERVLVTPSGVAREHERTLSESCRLKGLGPVFSRWHLSAPWAAKHLRAAHCGSGPVGR